MKKMLLTLTAVGVLAVPAGVTLAQDDDTTEPTEPVATCVEPDRDRDRDRDRERYRVTDPDAVVVEYQERTRLRLHDGTCDAECTGDQIRERDQVQLEQSDGTAAQHRAGNMGNGRNR